jgi:hypothetical protein
VFQLKFYNKFQPWTSSGKFFTIISDTGRTFGIWNLGKLYNKFQLWTTLRTLSTIFSNFGVYPGMCYFGESCFAVVYALAFLFGSNAH